MLRMYMLILYSLVLVRAPDGAVFPIGSVRVGAVNCTAPVSYTHLRAHETDSYLVCRLLLEKKN